jgi:LCP family protein required for cell wall assembly
MSDTRMRPRGDRAPIARHGRLGTPNAAAGVVKFLAVAVCVVLVSAVSVVAIAVGRVSHFRQIDLGDNPANVPSIGAYSGAVNLLLVGSDTREGQKGHYGTDPGSTLNDVNILLHISQDHSKATVISFPRDMYVNEPACKNPATGGVVPAQTDVKINSILHTAGVACVRDTVSRLTGLTIPFLAMITFDGVVQMSNAVGGVEVCVASPINDDYTELHLSKGVHTLKGADALKFLRTRHGVGDGSDLTRISSQQVFLSSLVRKLKAGSTLTDVTKLYGIASAAAHSMTLSTSLANIETMVSIARAVAPVDLNKVVFVQYPTTLQGDGVVPNTSAATILMNAVTKDKTLKLSKPNTADAKGSVVEGSDSSSSSKAGSSKAGSSASSSASATPRSTKKDSTVTLPSGVLGQTAAQKSCSVGNNLGTR